MAFMLALSIATPGTDSLLARSAFGDRACRLRFNKDRSGKA